MLFLLILITITIIIIISLIITIMVIISDPPSLGWTLTVGGHSSVSNEDKSKQNQKPRPSYWWGWWQRQSTEKSRDRSGTLDFVTSGSNFLYVLFFFIETAWKHHVPKLHKSSLTFMLYCQSFLTRAYYQYITLQWIFELFLWSSFHITLIGLHKALMFRDDACFQRVEA